MTDWTSLPEAASILADCAANPPPLDQRTSTFDRSYPMFRVDDRVKRLRAIRLAAEPPLDTPEWNRWLVRNEQAAIMDARMHFLSAELAKSLNQTRQRLAA